MNTRTLAALAAASLLALAGCSSDTPATPGGTTPGGTTPGGSLGGFCGAMDAFTTLDATMTQASDDLTAATSDLADPKDPAALAAIQTWGAAAVDASDQAVAYLQAAKSDVTDPDVQAALDTMMALYTGFVGPVGQSAASATDATEYSYAMLDLMSDETLMAALNEAPAASAALVQYESANCTP